MSTSTTYTVDYIVNVINGEALSQLNSMRIMMNKLGKSVQILDRLNQRLTKLNSTLHNKSWKVNLNTSDAERKLTALETQLDRVRGKAAGMGFGTTGNGSRSGTSTSTSLSSQGYRTTSSGIVKASGGKIVYNGHNGVRTLPSTPSRSTVVPTNFASESNLRSVGFPTNQPYHHSYGKPQGYSGRNSKQISPNRRMPQNTRGIPRHYWWTHIGEGSSVIDVPYIDITNGGVGQYYPPAPYNGAGGNGGGNNNNSRRGKKRRGGSSGRRNHSPNNLTYKLFGPTPLTNNGGMAIDMLKGMGVAYGIAGIGSAFGNIITDATEYDNTMQTVHNILQAHNAQDNFEGKFADMSKTIRQVGKQTKFKVTEVADAAKFLAMAGLHVGDITTAINPIADIALVGDTDLGETADLVTNIMTGYGKQAYQMRHVSDVMTNTFTMTNTTLPEIAESYKYAASLLNAGGISFEESTAGVGILGDAGIKGSQAGTTLRTIMANIVNPTKKQKKKWDEFGIERFENGQVRSLVDIFTELRDKGLKVEDFYQIFHKTAAQGAVSLASNVDKWNQVVEENFLSDGMVARLAENKKNTIQGLWAQLTSTFTDDGVVAFQGVQSQIKDILINIREWLDTDDAKKKISDMFQTFMEFVHLMIDASKYLYNFYLRFGLLIKLLVKAQLYIWPLVKAFGFLKATFLTGVWITRTAVGIGMITKAFAGLSVEMGAASARGAAFKNLMGSIATGNMIPLLPWTSGTVTKADVDKAKAGWSATSTTGQSVSYGTGAAPINQKRGWKAVGKTVGIGVGGMAGAALGGYLGSQIGEPGSGWNLFSSLVGFAGGGTLATWAGTLSVAPYLAIAAVLGGIIWFFKRVGDGIDACGKKADELAKKMRLEDGILQGSDVTGPMGFLDQMLGKETEITKKIEERLGLRDKENSLLNPDKDKQPVEYGDNSRAKSVIDANDKFYKFFSPNNFSEKTKGQLLKFLPQDVLPYYNDAKSGEHLVMVPTDRWGKMDLTQKGGWGWKYGWAGLNGEYHELSKEQAFDATALYQQGMANAKILGNQYFNDLHRYWKTGTADDIRTLKERWLTQVGTRRYYPITWNRSHDQVVSNDDNRNQWTLPYKQGLYDASIASWGPQAEIYANVIKAFDTHKREDALKALSYMFSDEYTQGYFQTYRDSGVEAMLKNLNYENGSFGIKGHDGKWVASKDKTEYAFSQIEAILSTLNASPDWARQAMAPDIQKLLFLKYVLGATLEDWNGEKKSIIPKDLPPSAVINGITYKLDPKTQKYLPEGDYSNLLPGWSGLTQGQFYQLYKNNPTKQATDILNGLTSYIPSLPTDSIPGQQGFLAYTPNAAYKSPSLVANIDQTSYRPPVNVYTDKPVAHGNQLLATNGVGTMNVNIYPQNPASPEMLAEVKSHFPSMMGDFMQQVFNAGTGDVVTG